MTGQGSLRTQGAAKYFKLWKEKATQNRRRPPPPASWQSPEAFVASMHLFPNGRELILPTSGHTVENEGWPLSDKADDKKKGFLGPQRTGFQHPPGSPGGPQLAAPTLPSL